MFNWLFSLIPLGQILQIAFLAAIVVGLFVAMFYIVWLFIIVIMAPLSGCLLSFVVLFTITNVVLLFVYFQQL